MLEQVLGLDWATIWIALASLVTAATAITALTPTKADDRFLGILSRILNFLAGNVLHNANKDDKDEE